jgi:hypothetical protein
MSSISIRGARRRLSVDGDELSIVMVLLLSMLVGEMGRSLSEGRSMCISYGIDLDQIRTIVAG